MRARTGLVILFIVSSAGSAAGPAHAQGVSDRTPNLDDGWIVPPGVVQFNFLHRFEVSPPPFRKVTSFPNFRLATGLPLGFDADLDYATNSTVFTGIPNEYQLALRRPVLRESRGAALDLTATAGYAFAPRSVDAEVSLARRFGRLRLLGTVRGMTSGYDVQRSLWGVGSGVVVQLTSWLSLAGDVFGMMNAPVGADLGTAWGAGAQLRIPYSPHSLSVQVSNTQSASIEGSSRGVRGAHMVGFEFTIPFTLARYFGRRRGPDRLPPATLPGDGAMSVPIANYAFSGGTLHVRVGTIVQWRNRDQVAHTVTADDGSFASGSIEPGERFERVFATPGTYAYHCAPHPFMTGRIVVGP